MSRGEFDANMANWRYRQNWGCQLRPFGIMKQLSCYRQRAHSDTILQKLNIIRLAQQAGFTIVEIQTLLHNLPADAPPSARWQVMAEQKLTELDERMQTMQAMKALLEQTLNCECETLEACGSGIENGATSGVTLNC